MLTGLSEVLLVVLKADASIPLPLSCSGNPAKRSEYTVTFKSMNRCISPHCLLSSYNKTPLSVGVCSGDMCVGCEEGSEICVFLWLELELAVP